jgi:outer membrane protein with beta-barrel domain
VQSAVALLLAIVTTPAFAQGFHLGVKAGVPLTQYFETGASGSRYSHAEYSAATRRYTVGAAAEWRMNNRFGFEVDALYHRMGYVAIIDNFSPGSGISDHSAIDVKGNSWDFPLLAKYRFGRVVRPFVEAGGVLRYVGPVRGKGEDLIHNLITGATSQTPIDITDPSDLRKRFYPGVTLAGGVEFGAGRLRVLPELRYTHWTANINGPQGPLRFAPNQAELLVGILF